MLSLLRSRRALAGLEFAIVAPFLVLLLLGTADVARALVMARRLTVAADAVATIASTQAVQIANLNVLTAYQAYAATTAPFALFPTWLASQKSTNNSFAITLSEVNFKPTVAKCTADCSYTGNVFWSVANPSGQAQLRACGALTSVANGTTTSLKTLPASTFGATSLFVADVSQVFVPLFTAVFLGNVTLTRTAYVSPRVNNAVTLQAGYSGPSLTCPSAAL